MKRCPHEQVSVASSKDGKTSQHDTYWNSWEPEKFRHNLHTVMWHSCGVIRESPRHSACTHATVDRFLQIGSADVEQYVSTIYAGPYKEKRVSNKATYQAYCLGQGQGVPGQPPILPFCSQPPAGSFFLEPSAKCFTGWVKQARDIYHICAIKIQSYISHDVRPHPILSGRYVKGMAGKGVPMCGLSHPSTYISMVTLALGLGCNVSRSGTAQAWCAVQVVIVDGSYKITIKLHIYASGSIEVANVLVTAMGKPLNPRH